MTESAVGSRTREAATREMVGNQKDDARRDISSEREGERAVGRGETSERQRLSEKQCLINKSWGRTG